MVTRARRGGSLALFATASKGEKFVPELPPPEEDIWVKDFEEMIDLILPFGAAGLLNEGAEKLTADQVRERLKGIPDFPLEPFAVGKTMDIADAMEFFRLREGEWLSKRMTHHLAFRRQENGESRISVQLLEADDERVRNLCKLHNYAEDAAMGGCLVNWRATLQWDQEGDAHAGEAIFALVADPDSKGRRGKILRDRGYAEIVPIAGDFYMDEEDSLFLVTPYEGGEVTEKFFYEGPDILFRLSTVKRMGGFGNATYAIETRIPNEIDWEGYDSNVDYDELSVLGPIGNTFAEMEEYQEKMRRRFGFGNTRLKEKLQGTLGKKIEIDESKLPPSLRMQSPPPPTSGPGHPDDQSSSS